jgi:hypothetical protein
MYTCNYLVHYTILYYIYMLYTYRFHPGAHHEDSFGPRSTSKARSTPQKNPLIVLVATWIHVETQYKYIYIAVQKNDDKKHIYIYICCIQIKVDMCCINTIIYIYTYDDPWPYIHHPVIRLPISKQHSGLDVQACFRVNPPRNFCGDRRNWRSVTMWAM